MMQAPITDANPTVEAMQARIARFAALRPTADYVDADAAMRRRC